jgi:hypothetical protein
MASGLIVQSKAPQRAQFLSNERSRCARDFPRLLGSLCDVPGAQKKKGARSWDYRAHEHSIEVRHQVYGGDQYA